MKKWCFEVIIFWFLVLVIWGSLIYVIDPFYHYHKQYTGIYNDYSYPMYQNDGIAKNYKYNAVIAGTSTSLNYSVKEANDLLEMNFIRLSYPGEGFMRISEGIRTAIDSKNDVNLVIWSLDPMWFITDKDYEGHTDEGYPDYLYNNSVLDDFQYLYNMDLMVQYAGPNFVRSLKKEAGKSFDSDIGGAISSGIDYIRGQRENLSIDASETENYFEMLQRNVDSNIAGLIKQHPDTKFIFVIAPYNIAWWDSLYLKGEGTIERRLEMEKYVVSNLLEYDNVEIYSFNTEKELVCNVKYYTDSVHPTSIVPSMILQSISKGENRISTDNCDEYFEKEQFFYTTFDYDSFFNE